MIALKKDHPLQRQLVRLECFFLLPFLRTLAADWLDQLCCFSRFDAMFSPSLGELLELDSFFSILKRQQSGNVWRIGRTNKITSKASRCQRNQTYHWINRAPWKTAWVTSKSRMLLFDWLRRARYASVLRWFHPTDWTTQNVPIRSTTKTKCKYITNVKVLDSLKLLHYWDMPCMLNESPPLFNSCFEPFRTSFTIVKIGTSRYSP